jgi:hypothetical protein
MALSSISDGKPLEAVDRSGETVRFVAFRRRGRDCKKVH